jgi:hypothetical protein
LPAQNRNWLKSVKNRRLIIHDLNKLRIFLATIKMSVLCKHHGSANTLIKPNVNVQPEPGIGVIIPGNEDEHAAPDTN